jgi:hypothetical protein
MVMVQLGAVTGGRLRATGNWLCRHLMALRLVRGGLAGSQEAWTSRTTQRRASAITEGGKSRVGGDRPAC